jgi:sigma-B regulation protein RsbU (phosphoserine phosphatase)
MFFAYCVNVILFHYKVDDFLKSKKIEIKTVELNQTLKAIKKDIQVAKKIQSSLIQQSYHTDLPLNVELAYIPLEDVGGDIYDICEFGRHGVRIFLADATGHGVQAALITMAIKAEYESLKKELKSPKKLLKSLNQNFIEKFSSIASFFSCVLVDIYPEKNKIVYSSAGHPDQIIQLKSWEIVHLQRLGKLIGISKDSEYDEKEVNFEIGDKLFLFTDGLFEEFNHKKEEFGEKQIINILRAYSDKELKELFPILMKNMDQFLQHSTRQDDISFIAVEHLQESV